MKKLPLLFLLVPTISFAESYICSFDNGDLDKYERVGKKFIYSKKGEREWDYDIYSDGTFTLVLITGAPLTAWVVVIDKTDFTIGKSKTTPVGGRRHSGNCEVVN